MLCFLENNGPAFLLFVCFISFYKFHYYDINAFRKD